MTSQALAQAAYHYAERNYGKKDARYDVIVECMTLSELEAELTRDGVTSEAAAYTWVDKYAGAQHEQELNQAWDGPESVESSSKYNPMFDPRY